VRLRPARPLLADDIVDERWAARKKRGQQGKEKPVAWGIRVYAPGQESEGSNTYGDNGSCSAPLAAVAWFGTADNPDPRHTIPYLTKGSERLTCKTKPNSDAPQAKFFYAGKCDYTPSRLPGPFSLPFPCGWATFPGPAGSEGIFLHQAGSPVFLQLVLRDLLIDQLHNALIDPPQSVPPRSTTSCWKVFSNSKKPRWYTGSRV